MARAWRGVAVGVALAVAIPASGAELPALEGAIRQACLAREQTLAARTRLMAEAGAAADEVARQSGRSAPAPRADRALEDALKRFDSVAGGLDQIDRKSAEQSRTIATLRRRFEEAATAETARLTAAAGPDRIGEVARALHAIEEMRRRVAQLVAPDPGFRPVLELRLAAGDDWSDVSQKLQLLEAERVRVTSRIAALEAEDQVMATRILLKRQLLAQLQSAVRIAGPDLALVRREAEDVTGILGEVVAQREALGHEKADLDRTLVQLDGRRNEFRARLESLESKGDHR